MRCHRPVMIAASFLLLCGVVAFAARAQNAIDRRDANGFLALPVQAKQPAVRFAAVEIFADTGGKPLAAYQVLFRAKKGAIKIVGVEEAGHAAIGGEHFFYDRDALNDALGDEPEHIIVAAYNAVARGNESPTGRVRLATIHVALTGGDEPVYEAKQQAAATTDGTPLELQISVK